MSIPISIPPLFQIGNRYALIEKLGQGGMGAVYRAFDRLNQQMVALKRVAPPTDDPQRSTLSASDNILLAMAVEFRTLASLRHPNIISVLDYGFEADGQPYFTMELLHDARTITEVGQGQPLETQVRYLNELLLALAYLHRRGVIHRDLKPDNVIVTPDGQVKVLDFGLVTGAAIQSITNYSEKRGGTVAYMAPETFYGEKATIQSDLYGVGIIAYELFLSQYPFNTQNIALLFSDILNKLPDTSSLYPALASLLDRLLMKTPAARPADAESVIHALCEAAHQPLPPENHVIRESFLQASKFVGRDRELDHLRTILRTALEGESAFILIGGESGVGKSRLVDELRIRALVEDVTVLRGQGIADSGLPFQLWRTLVRRLILSTPMSDLEAGILKAVVPDISTILGREVADPPEVSGTAWQQRIILMLVDLFKRQHKPVLVLLEDLQWEAESLAVLRQMLTIREQLPQLCVIGTYRDDEKPDLPAELPGMQVIDLKRLDAAAIADLSESMLGEAGKQPQVIDLLQRETEGNAFFMVEVVRALAEDAGRLADIGRMTLPQHIFSGGVQRVVQRRLDRLPELIRAWLKQIAVAGRELDLAIVDRLSMTYFAQGDIIDPSSLARSIDELLTLCANAAVLEVLDGMWRFSHDKIREALLEELTPEEWSTLHRQVADAIEAVYPNDASYNEVLLEHWHQAGELDKELHYLNLVAEHLIYIAARYSEARMVAERGLRRLPADDDRRAALLIWQARAYYRQGDYERTQALAQRALDAAKRTDDHYSIATSLSELGNTERNLGNYAQAKDSHQQGLAIWEALGDQRGIANSLNNLGTVAMFQSDYEQARDYHLRSLDIRREIGDQPGIASSLGYLGTIAYRLGEYAQSRDYHQQSLVIRRAIGDQSGLAYSLTNLGIVAGDLGEVAQAQDYHWESLMIRRAIGDQSGLALSHTNLGLVARRRGEYVQAKDYLQQGLDIRRAIGDQSGIASSLNTLGIVAYDQGFYALAKDYLQQSLAIFRDIGDRWGITLSLSTLSFVSIRTQDDQTRTTLHEGLAVALSIYATPRMLEFVVGFAWLHLKQGEATRAAELAGLAEYHPAYSSDAQQWLNELLSELEKSLSTDDLNAAIERGKTLDLNTVVTELLANSS